MNKYLVKHVCPTFFPNECHETLGVFDSEEDILKWFYHHTPYTFKCGRIINEKNFAETIKNYIQIDTLNYNFCPINNDEKS